MEDGTIQDAAGYGASFNNRPINRITIGAAILLDIEKADAAAIENNLRFIANNCRFDGEGADAWGIFDPTPVLGNKKLWLVFNEVGGYTLMLPSEY